MLYSNVFIRTRSWIRRADLADVARGGIRDLGRRDSVDPRDHVRCGHVGHDLHHRLHLSRSMPNEDERGVEYRLGAEGHCATSSGYGLRMKLHQVVKYDRKECNKADVCNVIE